jgi:diguanylate cyclase (GGDEF)-like protein
VCGDKNAIEALKNNKENYQQVFRVRTMDSTFRSISETVQIKKISEGHWYLVGVCSDVTAQKQSEERLQMMMTSAKCVLWQTDIIQADNPTGEVTLEWQAELLGESLVREWLEMPDIECREMMTSSYWLRHEEDRRMLDQCIATVIAEGNSDHRYEYRLFSTSGRMRWIDENIRAVQLSPRHWRLTGVSVDITERKQNEMRLEHQAYHDSLTGLPNRNLLIRHITQCLDATEKSDFALICFNLDNFKTINDSLGYGAGDTLIHSVAQRLSKLLRPNDVLARQGGDDFALLLPNLPLGHLGDVIEEVRQALREPIYLEGRAISLTASMGVIHITPQMTYSPYAVLQNANATMHQAKQQHKGDWMFFNPDITQKARERLEMEGDLREAVATGALTLNYQPIVYLDTHNACHVEALVRWTHPRWGIVSPAQFIPLAEESAIILDLGEWVLREACRQVVVWSRLLDKPVGVSVNLSMQQLQQQSIPEIIARVLEETECPAHLLCLEVTETVMMTQADDNIKKLLALQEMGIRIALDDFGTGYSSLSYLSRMPVSTLKIDRAFVTPITQSTDDQAIARAIVFLGNAIGANVVAEGIETEEQARYLQMIGCERAQGYFFARPMPAAQTEAWLVAHGNPNKASNFSAPQRKAA